MHLEDKSDPSAKPLNDESSKEAQNSSVDPRLVSHLRKSRGLCINAFVALIVSLAFVFFEFWVIISALPICRTVPFTWFILKLICDSTLTLIALIEVVALLREISQLKKRIHSLAGLFVLKSFSDKLVLPKAIAGCVSIGLIIWGITLWDYDAAVQCDFMMEVLRVMVIVNSLAVIITCLLPCVLLCVFGAVAISSRN